jgi:peptidoglycan/LPS O-acetylase OafA/YrhL
VTDAVASGIGQPVRTKNGERATPTALHDTPERARYRSDIDGLRTLAVVPVVLFHAGFRGFSGGFVGVDIFFVISGFLITGILHREALAGDYSILKFYERRIRRIFPALFTLLAATYVAGVFILLPSEMVGLGRQLLATTLFISNLLFWHDSGYFEAASVTKPLLHTWSLAVEEQFYIVFPLILLVVARWRIKMLLPLIVIGALLSFGANVALIRLMPDAAFYSLPTRAWELAIGSIFAIVPRYAGRWREVIVLAGVAAIFISIGLYSESTPFPGYAALLPCLGAASILYAGEGTLVARALSLPPIRGIGLISYSLYLWHWPILVYAAFIFGRPLSMPVATAAVVLSVLFATASWWLVEQPVRRKASIRTIWIIGGGCLAISLAVSVATILANGFPGRYSPPANAIMTAASAENRALDQGYNCPVVRFDGEKRFGACALGTGADHPLVVVIGDSHAMALRDEFDRVMRAQGIPGTLVSIAGCPPLIGFDRVRDGSQCALHENRIRQYVEEVRPKAVLLVGSWRGALFSKDSVYLGRASHDDDSRLANIAAALSATVTHYQDKGMKVGVLLPVPGARDDVPNTLARGTRQPLAWAKSEFQNDFQRFYEAVRAARPDVIEDLAAPLCSDLCIVRTDRPIYMDANHVNAAGARLVAPVLDRAISRLVRSPSPSVPRVQ